MVQRGLSWQPNRPPRCASEVTRIKKILSILSHEAKYMAWLFCLWTQMVEMATRLVEYKETQHVEGVIPYQAIKSSIWPWANSMKFHKQRDLTILISKHFEFLNRTSIRKVMAGWNFQCSHLIFAYIFREHVYFLWHCATHCKPKTKKTEDSSSACVCLYRSLKLFTDGQVTLQQFNSKYIRLCCVI